jgi:hypothetical protein
VKIAYWADVLVEFLGFGRVATEDSPDRFNLAVPAGDTGHTESRV